MSQDPASFFRNYPQTGGGPAPKKRERSWLRIHVVPFTPSVDPRMPPLYQAAVEGLRSDGIAFGIPIMLKKAAIDVRPSAAQGLEIAVNAINGALEQLQSFRDCDCEGEGPCAVHKDLMEG